MRDLLVYPENPDTSSSFKHVPRFVECKAVFAPFEWKLKRVDLRLKSAVESSRIIQSERLHPD